MSEATEDISVALWDGGGYLWPPRAREREGKARACACKPTPDTAYFDGQRAHPPASDRQRSGRPRGPWSFVLWPDGACDFREGVEQHNGADTISLGPSRPRLQLERTAGLGGAASGYDDRAVNSAARTASHSGDAMRLTATCGRSFNSPVIFANSSCLRKAAVFSERPDPLCGYAGTCG